MNVSRPWSLLVALGDIGQGLVTLLTLGFCRPGWGASLRLAGLYRMASKLEQEEAPRG